MACARWVIVSLHHEALHPGRAEISQRYVLVLPSIQLSANAMCRQRHSSLRIVTLRTQLDRQFEAADLSDHPDDRVRWSQYNRCD